MPRWYDEPVKITFSAHARQQLRERNLSEAEVARAVERPERIAAQSPRRYRVLKNIRRERKSYLLVVICDRRNSTVEIVTAFLTSKLKKYL